MLPRIGVCRGLGVIRSGVPGPPEQIAWDDAPARVLERVGVGRTPTVVCVAGPVGSGKSTLADRILAARPGVRLATDDYLPDYDRVPEHERDEPASSHLPELCEHLAGLLAGRSVQTPVWSFHEHRRTGLRATHPAPLIVVEGIHALHPALDGVRTIGVLVHASSTTRWARWEALESAGQRGWGVEKARAFFETVADPTFERHRAIYHARADLVVLNDADHTPPDRTRG